MPIVFSRSVRSIETDGYRRSGLAFGVALALFAGWGAWFAFARVAVIEVAESARMEVDRAAHTVDAPVAGKIAAFRLVLGEEVKEGDVLAELDAEPLRLALEQEKAKQAAFGPRMEALADEIAAQERALEDQRRVAQARTDESRARRREAEATLAFAEGEMKRAASLRTEGVASEAEASRAKAEADQKRALLDAAELATQRAEAERRAAETERRATVAGLRKEVAQLEGDKAASVAALGELTHEIARRQIRAPVTGRVAEVASFRVGGVVKEGDRLGAIVPAGTVRIVAELLPAAAVGRVKPGQTARMRPDGFPWTEYGMLVATVRRVGSEPRAGRIRVELDVKAEPSSPIPIQHGLPGTLEIELERISPAALVFRAAGRRLAAPASATGTQEAARDDAR